MYVSRTPLRVSLFGGGSDYPSYFAHNYAGVIGGTIDKYVYTFISDLPKEATQKFRINYRTTESVSNVSEITHPVIREGLRLYADAESLNISTMSDVLGGSGLGSSSAFTVGFLNALANVRGAVPLRSQLWRDAVYIEREVLNESGGIQDQIHASIGGFKKYTFTSEGLLFEDLFDRGSKLAFLSSACFLVKIGGVRSSHQIANDQRSKTEKAHNTAYLSKMMALLDEAALIFKRSVFDVASLRQIGELLNESWQLKKNLGGSVTNPDVDELVDLIVKSNAFGCKLLGAGAAGYILVLADPESVEELKKQFDDFGILDFEFNDHGTEILSI